MWFFDVAEIEAAFDVPGTDDARRANVRVNGRRSVEANDTRSVIVDRCCSFLERFAGRAGDQAGGNGVP